MSHLVEFIKYIFSESQECIYKSIAFILTPYFKLLLSHGTNLKYIEEDNNYYLLKMEGKFFDKCKIFDLQDNSVIPAIKSNPYINKLELTSGQIQHIQLRYNFMGEIVKINIRSMLTKKRFVVLQLLNLTVVLGMVILTSYFIKQYLFS